MSQQASRDQQLLWLYSTGEHECSYLPNRRARTVFVDPRHQLTPAQYGALARQGMRRSGSYVYQPNCAACQACKSLRVDAMAFRPNRSQRRCLRRNDDLRIVSRPPVFQERHFRLYQDYLEQRHPGSSMADADPQRYMEFLVADWSQTRFNEIRRGDALLGVAVTDYLPDGLSAVYTFFDPQEEARSLGTWAILWQISEARAAGLAHVYLGYWIQQSPRMRYKTAFRPCEIHVGGRWQVYHAPADTDR